VSDSALDRVRQWELSGGSVQVFALTSDQVAVQLCTCTGEPMEQLVSDDPELLDYLRVDATTGPATTPPRCPADPGAAPNHTAAS
jgi:hypothetical protein